MPRPKIAQIQPTVVPAMPGYFGGFILYEPGYPLEIEWHPVVAWVVFGSLPNEFGVVSLRDVAAEPVIPDISMEQVPLIKYPDGRVIEPGQVVYASEKDAKQNLQIRYSSQTQKRS